MEVEETTDDGVLIRLTPKEVLVLRSSLVKEWSCVSRKYTNTSSTIPEEILNLASRKALTQDLKVGIISVVQGYKDTGVLK